MDSLDDKFDFSLMSWNILAPCWVKEDWYPSLFHLANDHKRRIELIFENIISLNCEIVFLQETQQNLLNLFEEKLGDKYSLEYSPNNPTSSSISNGLLTLIKKDWQYAKQIQIFNDILDPIKGEAIQFICLPSKNLILTHIHLDYLHSLSQLKLIKTKFYELFNRSSSISLLAGDFNKTMFNCEQFPSDEYELIFNEKIPTYYPDPLTKQSNSSVDQIIFNKNQLKLIQSGQAFQTNDRSLKDSLTIYGSDHIFIWATFKLI